MIDDKLVNYIRASLARRIPIEQTKRALLAKGWQNADVNEAIQLATAGKRQVPKQPIQRRISKQPIRRIQPNQKRAMIQPTRRMVKPQQKISQSPVQMTKPTQEKAGNKFHFSKKLIFISIGVIALVGIGVVIYFIMTNVSGISDTELSAGTSFVVEVDKEVKFNLDEQEHTLTVNSISDDSVDIVIQSDPILATLEVGETNKFDINSDSIYDLSLRLNSITDGKADLYIIRISEACVEDWECTEWSNCTEGIQVRICEDLNDCGTEKDKPDESQECETEPEINCSEYSGTDIDCFIEFAGSCSPSNLTYDFTINVLGWVQTNSYYFEIIDFIDGKCEIYEEVLSSSGEYSDTKRQSLLDEGNSEEEIDEMETEKNDELSDFVGESGICRYPYLENMLMELKEVGIILPIEDPETYDCTGGLYNSTNSSS